MEASVLYACLLVVMLPSTMGVECNMTADTCEFWLEVGYRLTMMNGKIAVYPQDGKLYRYDVTNTTGATTISSDDVVATDGWENSRLVIVANGTLPGPSIEVYEGQTIIIHVKNNLPSESTTIHWHGLHQPNTPWMDGVAYVNQCPIGPEQSFTYKFKAKPKGTYWYHSHIGLQRTMGLYGAFIIREKKPLEMPEFVAVINDWNHDWDSTEGYYRMVNGVYQDRHKVSGTGSLDGAFFSMFMFQSGLVNGKGRYYDSTGNHNGAPLEVFTVKQSQMYRFRWISAGTLYPFRISIDNHNITVVASDGYDLQPYTAESLIINPGERYDFYITTDQPVDNYWVRAITLELEVNHTAEAILRYDGSPEVEPNSTRKTCAQDDTCVVINCPFSFYPKTDYTSCVTFDDLKSLANDDPAPEGDVITDRFLNFAFPGDTWTPGSVNGRAFHSPSVSALTQPKDMAKFKCGDDCGEQKICKCAYTLDLEHNGIYQLVFMNMAKGKGWSHPVHMHGHSFYVVKMGYGSYNETTGHITVENMDIDCRGHEDRSQSFCNDATWKNTSWVGGNVPGMELKNPPRKDTIIVPTGGYVVVRIKADNPGVWFMHCHIELHNMDGMAMLINESFPNQPRPPPLFPKCGDFKYSTSDEHPPAKLDNEPTINTNGNMFSSEQFWVVTGVLAGVIVLLLFAVVCMICRKESRESDYKANIKTQDNTAFTISK